MKYFLNIHFSVNKATFQFLKLHSSDLTQTTEIYRQKLKYNQNKRFKAFVYKIYCIEIIDDKLK